MVGIIQATDQSVTGLAGTINSRVVQKGLKQTFEALGNRPMAVTYGSTVVEVYKSMGQRFYVTLEDKDLCAGIKFCGEWPDKSVDTVAECRGSEKDIRVMVGKLADAFGPMGVSGGKYTERSSDRRPEPQPAGR